LAVTTQTSRRAAGHVDPSYRISAILPVFSETTTLVDLAQDLVRLLGPDLFEIRIMTSPKSPSETLDACGRAGALFPNTRVSAQRQNPGVGFAYRQGIEEAEGDLLLLMDTDGEFDAETAPRLLAKQRETGADLVVGSRWMRGGGVEGYPPLKYLFNRVYQALFRLLYRTRIHDLTFGYKLGTAALLKSLPVKAQFQEIGCEITLRALKAGARVEEVPTVWRCRKEGASTNPLKRNLRYASLALSILLSPDTAAGGGR
jgi:dolichol-phosphate mannosyltransferase